MSWSIPPLIEPNLVSATAEDSELFTTVFNLVFNILAKAEVVYGDAQGYLDAIMAKLNNNMVIDEVNVVEPDRPVISFIEPPIPDLPDISAVQPPDLTFNYNETFYQSDLGQQVYAILVNEIRNGSTGLTATVEADIYARESERDLLELQASRDKIANIWAESGMSMPDGVLVSAINALQVEYQNKHADKSRDVRIESFKRADDNAKFVKDLAVKYEQVLMDYWGKYWDRQLKAAGAVLEYAVAVYDALMKFQGLYLERYKAESEMYKAIVTGQATVAEAKATVYDTESKFNLGVAKNSIDWIASNIELLKTQLTAAMSASGNIAQVASTMVAGSLSALNANASMGVSESYSNSSSISDSTNRNVVDPISWTLRTP